MQALLSLAARLQVSGTPSTDALLLREAAYRCIGEGYNHVSPHFSFQAWCVDALCPWGAQHALSACPRCVAWMCARRSWAARARVCVYMCARAPFVHLP